MEYKVRVELEIIVNVINSDNKIKRKIALLGCQVKARKEAVEAEAIELQN
ncbi:4102_t:CDS:2 [Cetraspora pellucida]|uniref:4102_t:CDS:1 n=1 Tax=Cetraspora pellucida TaxID=1433469 RepID=A0A9N9DMU1_9GLOM|nr:4102_t:CDS:2 [Cetraspora pellucida]